MQIMVTGGSGKLGQAVLRELMEHGHGVVNVDQSRPAERVCPTVLIDLADFGDVASAVAGRIDVQIDRKQARFDAIVHLAAISGAGHTSNARTFAANVTATHNVLEAARMAGIKNIVLASSETLLGLPFDAPPPYIPVDEAYDPRPETSYSLGKLVDEVVAAQFCRQDPDLRIVGLRFSNVMAPEEYASFPRFESDPASRRWNLWGYIDRRDGAQAVRLALEADFTGFETFIIANADTVMNRTSQSLVEEFFPDVPVRGQLDGTATMLDIGKAQRLLGYAPRHSWRDA